MDELEDRSIYEIRIWDLDKYNFIEETNNVAMDGWSQLFSLCDFKEATIRCH
jgi:hypothetical protein